MKYCLTQKVTRWLCILFDPYAQKCYECIAVYINGKPMSQMDKETMQEAISRRIIRNKEN